MRTERHGSELIRREIERLGGKFDAKYEKSGFQATLEMPMTNNLVQAS